MRTVHLDLREYTSPEVRVFCCRDRGKAIREHAGIVAGDHVEITVPEPTYALTTTFVFELLGGCTARVVNDEFHDGSVQESLADYARVTSFKGSIFPSPPPSRGDAGGTGAEERSD